MGAQAMPIVASMLSVAPDTSSWRLSAASTFSRGLRGVAVAREPGQEHAEAVALDARDDVGRRAPSASGARPPPSAPRRPGRGRACRSRRGSGRCRRRAARVCSSLVRGAERARRGLEQQRAVRQRGERVVEGDVLHLGRLPRGEVHRRHRQREERDEVEPVLGDHGHRRAEREQRGGGPATEDEIAA